MLSKITVHAEPVEASIRKNFYDKICIRQITGWIILRRAQDTRVLYAWLYFFNASAYVFSALRLYLM